MATLYTHDFEFSSASEFIKGQLYFDTNKQLIYKITATSDPFSNDFLKLFEQQMQYLSDLYIKKGSIKNIKVTPIS